MPDFRAYVRQHLPSLGLAGEREADVIEELALEFELRYERALQNGLTPEAAFAEIRKHAKPWSELADELRSALDRTDQDKPEKRHSNALFRFLGAVRQDLRYAGRQLCNSPMFTVIAVLTLASGIGANTAIFSLLNSVLLRDLPVREPRELVFFGKARAEGSTPFLANGQAFSYSFFKEFLRRNRVFSDVAAIHSIMFRNHSRVAGASELERVNIELVSGTYFETLGVSPFLGRLFAEGDDRIPGGHPVAVVSHSWWQARFARDPAIVGKTVNVGTTVYSILGVTPPGFFGVTVGQSPDLWIPLAMEKEISPGWNGLEDRLFQSLHIIARRMPGVSLQQAQADAASLSKQILVEHAGAAADSEQLDAIGHMNFELTPATTGRSDLRAQFSSPLKFLMAVVALVLIIACANVANLLLARANVRRREIAIRMSVGAARSRLIRQLLLESGLLASAGAILGVLLAWSASRILLAMVSGGSQVLPISIAPDGAVLTFTTSVTVLTVFLFGTVPALYATRLDAASSLQAARGVISVAGRNRFARGLVVAQVAISLTLLVCAGLFLRSLWNLMGMDPGFDKQNVLMMSIDPTPAGYEADARLQSMMERVEQRVASVPGIQGVSFAFHVLDGGGYIIGIDVPGRARSKTDPNVDHNIVGPQYLDVMKMPILSGRGLDQRDNAASRKVAVINESMARTYFPGGSPLGRTFGVGDEPDWQNVEVVGVVKDAKYLFLDEPSMPAAFYSHSQMRKYFLYDFVLRYAGDPAWIIPSVRRAIHEVDPNLGVGESTTLAKVVDDSVLSRRVVAQLSTFFGVLAVFLACLGLYGVMSYGVTRRTGEFGLRMALGAGRRQVLWVVLRETLWLVAAGVAIGLVMALNAGRFIEGLLFGLKSFDALTIVLATLVLTFVTALAGYFPARRATRIDPMAALRHD